MMSDLNAEHSPVHCYLCAAAPDMADELTRLRHVNTALTRCLQAVKDAAEAGLWRQALTTTETKDEALP